nr:reverse transcriptase domain-containing protein [Tanacetum cinerariifolium]
MRTRNSYFPNNSSGTIPRRLNKRRAPNVVELELRTIVEIAPMTDNRTIEELLQAPTEGYGEVIVIPEINVDQFEIKTNLLQLVQANPYYGFERENPHTHIDNFKRITSTLKFRDVPNDVIKLRDPLEFGGNLLSKTTREALHIIENKSKVRYSRNKPNVSRMNTTSRENASKTDDRIDKHADQISTLVDIFPKKVVTPATVKAIEESCVTYGGNHAYYNCDATHSNQSSVCAATGTYNQVAPQNCARNYMASPGFAPVQNNSQNRFNQNQGQGNNFNRGSNFHEPDVPKSLPKANIPYPLRLNDQKLCEKAMNQMEKFFQIFQDLHFHISFVNDLLLMPKFSSTIKSLLANKDKLFELGKIPLNENCSAMLLKKLPEKLGDLEKILMPCDFLGMDVCHALADLVVDFEADPRVPLILGRSFLWTGRVLTDVYGEEITLRVNDEVVTFNLNQTMRYSSTYDDMSVNRIDIIDVARDEYAQEMLGFSNNSSGRNPTLTSEPIIFYFSLSITPFERSDFILEEIEAYLKDDSISPEIDHADCASEGDI